MSNHETCPKCQEATKTIQEWVDKQSHERCWYYPDLFQKLRNVFNVKSNKNPSLPPRKEFEEGCRRYQEEQYSSNAD